MVEQRSSGVKRGKDNQRIGRHFMNFLYRAGERTIWLRNRRAEPINRW